jgi:hypothetical protein
VPPSPLLSRRALRGATRSTEKFGALWRPQAVESVPLVVIFSARPSALGWIASSLATGLPALVAVVRVSDAQVDVASATDSVLAADGAVVAACALAASMGANPATLGVVADGAATSTAMQLAAQRASDRSNVPAEESPRTPVSRLALIAPALPDAGVRLDIPSQFPPTLVQFAREGSAAAASAAVASQLAEAGVAVRATDYQAPRDGWVTKSRAVRQSQRGADDLVAFFARGFGAASTFHVIPGWELH